jgi:hypothetical protein
MGEITLWDQHIDKAVWEQQVTSIPFTLMYSSSLSIKVERVLDHDPQELRQHKTHAIQVTRLYKDSTSITLLSTLLSNSIYLYEKQKQGQKGVTRITVELAKIHKTIISQDACRTV